MRRLLLWMLPLIGGGLFLAFAVRDAQLLGIDLDGVRLIVYPDKHCKRNLSQIADAARAVVERPEFPRPEGLPTQADCVRLLAAVEASIAEMDCPLIHHEVASWYQAVPAMRDPQSPYVINPRIFTRPLDLWKDSDVVAADSRPRHFAAVEGRGIRCVRLVRWDSSQARAYFDEQQAPSLIRQLDQFADGFEGSDGNEAWLPFYEEPKLDLKWDYVRIFWHVDVIVLVAVVWIRLVLRSPANRQRRQVDPNELNKRLPS